jgi:hypothetical protein
MKKTIAVIAMAGLITCGCSHFRHRDNNAGGSYDSTQMNSGSNSSTNSNTTGSSIQSGTSSGSTSSSSDSSTSNPSDKTPK